MIPQSGFGPSNDPSWQKDRQNPIPEYQSYQLDGQTCQSGRLRNLAANSDEKLTIPTIMIIPIKCLLCISGKYSQ